MRRRLLLAAAAAAVFLPSVGGPFVFDTEYYLVGDPVVRAPASLGELLTRSRHPSRPVYVLLNAATLSAAGDRPAAWRAVSLVLHAGATVALHGLLLPAGATVALTAAALFAVHPAASMPVCYDYARTDLLVTLFMLLALLAHRRRRGLLTALFAALAGGANEKAVVLPLLALLCDRVLDPAPSPRRPSAYLPLLPAVLVPPALLLLVGNPHTTVVGPWRLHVLTLWVHLRAFVRAGRLLLGLGGHSIEHAIPFPGRLLDPAGLALLVLFAGALAGTWAARRRAPTVAFGLLGAAATLLPKNLLLVNLEPLVESHLYATAAFFAAALGGALVALARRAPGVAAAGIPIAAVLLLGLSAVQRAVLWTRPVLLYEEAARVSPARPRVWANLGAEYARVGRWREAERALTTAFVVDRSGPPERSLVDRAWNVGDYAAALAEAVAAQGRLDDALAILHDSRGAPTLLPIVRARVEARTLALRGRRAEAFARLEAALAPETRHPEAWLDLAVVAPDDAGADRALAAAAAAGAPAAALDDARARRVRFATLDQVQ